jgi:polysaccharide pyruvyl transferase WcaK-like protein
MDILIRAGGFSNKGGEAMMLTVQRELYQRIQGLNFLLRLTSGQAESARSLGFHPVVIESSRYKKGVSLLRQALSRSEVRKALASNILGALELTDIKRIDGVIDISGFGYSDVWGSEPAERSLVWVRHCHKKGIPYVYMPQAWGPFSNLRVARSVTKMCRFSSLVYARDEESFSYLSELSEENMDRIKLAPDIAFKFAGAIKETGSSLLKDLGIETGDYPLVGLTPNLRLYKRTEGEEINNSYIQLMIQIARHCMKQWNAIVVLIPHEIALGRSPQKDDRFLCSLIYDGVSSEGRAANISDNLSADAIKAMIANLDFLIGSRFHSLVFALTSRVPAVALGWAHKYGELMRYAGMEDFSMDLKNLDEREVIDLMERAWTKRAESRKLLSERIPQITDEVDAVFDEVAAVFGRNG